MKMKTLVAVVVSSFLAAPVAYAAAASTGDNMNSTTMQQSPSADMNNPVVAAAPNANAAMPSDPSVAPVNGPAQNDTLAMRNSGSNPGVDSRDDMSADTATGDDDY